MWKPPASAFLISVSLTLPTIAQSEDLDAQVAAGKAIYLAETHRLGCERCHGPDGTAKAEGRTFAAERSIRGKSAQEIQIAIMATPMMWSIKLTEEEREQVAAYLAYLQSNSD
jgi:mono/diheme cytochrome c family protein